MRRILALVVGGALALLGGCRSAPAVTPVTATHTASPTYTATPAPLAAIAPTPTRQPGPTNSPHPPTSAPTGAPAPTTTIPPSFPPAVELQPWLRIPAQITHLSAAPDGSGRLFVTEKQGRVRIIKEGQLLAEPFLDIRSRVDATASERGLLSIAFPPDYAQSNVFYVNYTAKDGDGDTIIARYHVSDDPDLALAESEEIILRIDQPAANHNGGQLQFGPDGYLYIGMGDGGRANDPWDNAENLSSLLGKMLRIDVRVPRGYRIPADNPFVGNPQARPEIWAYGLRNPWRFSFDRQTGDLYIADVGHNLWEEIDFQPANSAGGEHYGWDTTEGFHCFEPEEDCDMTGITLPVAEYGHDHGCSITGGAVYRGQAHPAWWGTYFFADFCSGEIWALRSLPDQGWTMSVVATTELNPASFGLDADGELYILDLDGEIMQLQEAKP